VLPPARLGRGATQGVRATIILSGMDPCNIARVIDGEEVGTIFLATH